MKKYTAFLLAAGLLFSLLLAGCGKTEIKLLPENAILDDAPDVVLEPDKPPYNLGGWREDNEVVWKLDVPQEGTYRILISYSRPGREPTTWGTVRLYGKGREDTELNFSVRPTGKDNKDWSVYDVNDASGAHLKPGPLYLSIRPNFPDNYRGTEYFINLRSVTLQLED